MSCPDRSRIVAWLETGEPAPALERHLARCERCAKVLEHEAAFEEALYEIAESRPARPTRAGWVLAVIAAAASVLLLLGTVTAERSHEPAPGAVHVRALDAGPPDAALP